MASKKLRIGTLMSEKKKGQDGKEYTSVYLGLGNQGNKDPKYNTYVELVVKDNNGKVLHTQKNGFVSLVDPRKQPKDLLDAGIITEDEYEKKMSNISKLPEKIRYTLELKTS